MLIEIGIAASIGGIVGFGICAVLTAGKVADNTEPDCLNCYDCGWVCENHRDQPWEGISSVAHACDCGGAGSPCPVCEWDMATAGIRDETERAHTRCADALTAKTARIDRALEQVTPGANATVKRMAAILRGDA